MMIIFLLAVAVGRYCSAYEPTTEDYRATIALNQTEIEHCEQIKEQIAKTTKAIEKQKWYDAAFVDILHQKWQAQDNYQKSLSRKNEEIKLTIKQLEQPKVVHRYIGHFKITHYCNQNYPHGCNDGDATNTASGTKPTPGRTIAVDPKKIPYGTEVVIGDHIYIAEDAGGAIKGNRIDICVASHSEALQKGVLKNVPVYIVEKR